MRLGRLLLGIALSVVSTQVWAQTASVSATSTAASSLTISGGHVLQGFTVVPSVAGYAMMWDSNSAPSNGTVSPLACFPVTPPISGGPNPYVSMSNASIGVLNTTGITVAFSTTGCFTFTATAAYISIVYLP